jgi:hypothetical protein
VENKIKIRTTKVVQIKKGCMSVLLSDGAAPSAGNE